MRAEHLPDLHPHLAVAWMARLPARSPYRPHDRIDVLSDPFHDDRRAVGRELLKNRGQRAGVPVDHCALRCARFRPVGFDDLTGELEKILEQLNALFRRRRRPVVPDTIAWR